MVFACLENAHAEQRRELVRACRQWMGLIPHHFFNLVYKLLNQFDFAYVCAWYGFPILGGSLLPSKPGEILIVIDWSICVECFSL
jgi:hypothetical protein